MSLPQPDLFSLARSKLHLSVGSRETRSLHRWVLLKNSITSSSPTATSFPPPSQPSTSSQPHSPEGEPTESEEYPDTFMFPDAGKLLTSTPSQSSPSEAQWLDTLLADLADEDEEDFALDHPVPTSEDDDESFLLSPLISPMSSSDDLASSETYFQPHPYPVPYPPYRPPALQHPVDDPLPYSHVDDAEECAVPDAIEDTSDDESDTPTTPSLGRSNEGFPALHRSQEAPFAHIDPASVPQALPSPSGTPRRRGPHVYVDPSDVSFYPFELDPLPFSNNLHSYNYQEC